MQLFLNCFGNTQVVSFEQGCSVNELLSSIPFLQVPMDSCKLVSSNGVLAPFTLLDSQFDGISLNVCVDVLGGKGKKKRKQYSTPKKNKHIHKNVKQRVLSYYAIQKNGEI